VRKEGNHLRITAQLINAKDGTHIWSQTFDRELTGVFAVQEEIAMAVSGALSITLDVAEMSRQKGGTTNVEAYDKYLRARKLSAWWAQATRAYQFADQHKWSEAHFTNFSWLWSYYETNLRSDSRFKVLLRDLGLADYFRASGNRGDFCKPLGKDDFECH
jgi:hypothetical protein